MNNAENTLKDGFKRKIGNEDFILDEDKLVQQIDQAVGFVEINGEKLRYFGAYIPQYVTETLKNKSTKEEKEVKLIQEVPCIILEDGRIRSIKSEDIEFEFSTVMGKKVKNWSLKSIDAFSHEKLNFNYEELFRAFKQPYEDHMVFEHKEWYDFNALWDIATYHYDLIDKFLIIKHEGISGTAKSKGMKISANQSFNGKKFLKPTPAAFFRYREKHKATICIEEAEKLFSDKLGNNDAELVEYLNGSYEKGNTVPRQNDKNINETDEFDPAGFTRIGSIETLKGALKNRSVTITMIKAPANDFRGNSEVPAHNNPEFKKNRDMAYICSLNNYRGFVKNLEQLENIFGLANREWVVAKPILAVAKCVSDELFERMGKFIAQRFDIRTEIVDELSWGYLMAEILIEYYAGVEEGFISNEELKNKFVNRVHVRTGTLLDKLTTHKITKIMQELSLTDFKGRNFDNTVRGYNINFWQLENVLRRNQILEFEKIKKILSNLSNCPISEEKYFITVRTNNGQTDKHAGQKDSMDKKDKNIEIAISKFSYNELLEIVSKLPNNREWFIDDFKKELGISDEIFDKLLLEGEIEQHKAGFVRVLK